MGMLLRRNREDEKAKEKPVKKIEVKPLKSKGDK